MTLLIEKIETLIYRKIGIGQNGDARNQKVKGYGFQAQRYSGLDSVSRTLHSVSYPAFFYVSFTQATLPMQWQVSIISQVQCSFPWELSVS